MKKFNIFIVFLLLTSYSDIYSQGYTIQRKYCSKPMLGMRLDTERIMDKQFCLSIPKNINIERVESTTTDIFFHRYSTNKSGVIVVIYNPFIGPTDSISKFSMNTYDFKILCDKHNILSNLNNENILIKNNRYFGLKKLGKSSFYILYLNVKKRHDVYFENILRSAYLLE